METMMAEKAEIGENGGAVSAGGRSISFAEYFRWKVGKWIARGGGGGGAPPGASGQRVSDK